MKTRTIYRKLRTSPEPRAKDIVPLEPVCDPIWDSKNNIGMASVQGKKWKQLDRMLANGWLADAKISNEEWGKTLSDTFDELQRLLLMTFRQKNKLGYTPVLNGACASAVFLQGNNLYIANTGDCHVFFVGVVPGLEPFSILLNDPHQLSSCSNTERERLKKFAEVNGRNIDLIIPNQFDGPAKKWNQKLAGVIGVTRAFGYEQYHIDGLTHQPECAYLPLPIIANSAKGFIVAVSSSLMKSLSDTKSQIGSIVFNHCEEKPDLIAKALVLETAKQNPSRSSSAAVMPLTDLACKNKVRYMVMVRGLNNDNLAQCIVENFDSVLFFSRPDLKTTSLTPQPSGSGYR